MEGERVGARLLTRRTSGVKGRVGIQGCGLEGLTNNSIIHTNLHKSNNKLVNA